MSKPGVMLYFDIVDPLRMLPDADVGKLFFAIMNYGKTGELPEFDGALAVAWGFIRPKLDFDSSRYENSANQKKYAVYCRKVKDDRLSYDEWLLLSDNGRERALSSVSGRIPSTSPSTSTQDSIKAAQPPTRHRFSPPSVDDVRSYCHEKGYTIDPEKFVDYYQANGWRIGKNPMKDWKAAVRTWVKRDQPSATVTVKEEFPDGCPWTVV